MYIRVHHSLIKSSPALSHQLLWAKQGVTYVEIFIDRFLIDMKENTPNTTLLNPIGNVSAKANLNWSFFLESTFLRKKYINIIKNPHAIECILVELNIKWNWLPKTFPFLLGVSVGERTAGAQKTFIMFNMRSGRGGKLKQRSRRERQQSRGQPAPSVGVERQGRASQGAPSPDLAVRHLQCETAKQTGCQQLEGSRRTADWNRSPLRPRRGCAGRPVPFRLLTHSFLTYHDEYL